METEAPPGEQPEIRRIAPGDGSSCCVFACKCAAWGHVMRQPEDFGIGCLVCEMTAVIGSTYTHDRCPVPLDWSGRMWSMLPPTNAGEDPFPVIACFRAEANRRKDGSYQLCVRMGDDASTPAVLMLGEEDFSAFCNPVARDRADDVLIATLEGCAQAIFGPYALEDGLIEIRNSALSYAVASGMGMAKAEDVAARAAVYAKFIETGAAPEKKEEPPRYYPPDNWLGELGLGVRPMAGDPLGQRGPEPEAVLRALIRERPGWFVGDSADGTVRIHLEPSIAEAMGLVGQSGATLAEEIGIMQERARKSGAFQQSQTTA